MAALDTADELAIRNLLARYGDAVCRRDPDAWIATWSHECTWDLGGGRVTHGREATLELWRTAITKYPWVAQVPASGEVSLVDAATGTYWSSTTSPTVRASCTSATTTTPTSTRRASGASALAASTWCTAARWTPAP